MVQTINDPSKKKKNMEFRYNPKVRSFLGFSHNPIRFQITFGHEKSPYPKYIYIISISYIIILQKKNWIMFPWIIEKLLLQWACIWRFPKSWGYPKSSHHPCFRWDFPMFHGFFPRKQLFWGTPKNDGNWPWLHHRCPRYKALLTRKISEIKRFLGNCSWLRRRWSFCSKTQSLRLRSWENIYYMCVYIYTHVYNRNCILYNLYN